MGLNSRYYISSNFLIKFINVFITVKSTYNIHKYHPSTLPLKVHKQEIFYRNGTYCVFVKSSFKKLNCLPHSVNHGFATTNFITLKTFRNDFSDIKPYSVSNNGNKGKRTRKLRASLDMSFCVLAFICDNLAMYKIINILKTGSPLSR